MTKQVQIRRGTDSQHTSFTGAEGEISVNTTNDSVHVHDGTTAGGKEMARADGSNVAFTGGTIDGAVIGGTTPAAGTFTTGDFNTSLNVDGTITSDGLTVDGNATIQNTGNSYRTISLDANRTAAVNTLGRLDYKWNGNEVVRLHATSGSDTTNKDNGSFSISTSDDGTLDQRLKIDSNGDISFYEDTGTTAKFFWDASAEALGIGTTSPSFNLTAKGAANQAFLSTEDSTSTYRAIYGSDSAVGAGAVFGSLSNHPAIIRTNNTERMRINSSGNVGIGTSSPDGVLEVSAGSNLNAVFDQLSMDNASNEGIGIEFSRTTSTTALSALGITDTDKLTFASREGLHFYTGGAGSYSATSEVMRIDSSGNLLVGMTSGIGTFTNAGVGISSSSNYIHAVRDGNIPLFVGRKTSDGEIVRLYKDSTVVGSIGSNSGTKLYVGAGDAAFRFDPDNNSVRPHNASTNGSTDNFLNLGTSSNRFKDLYLGGSVYLGGTAAANALDDYEEGTWTPTDNSGGLTLTIATGHYIKIGQFVYVWYQVEYPSNSDTNASQISGLPFAASGNQTFSGSISITNYGNSNILGMFEPSVRYIKFRNYSNNSITNANLSGKFVYGTAAYITT